MANSDEKNITNEVLENGDILETFYVGGEVCSVTYKHPDGSYEVFSGEGYKKQELTADGIYRVYKYKTDKIDREVYPDKTIITYHDNGRVSTIEKADKSYVSYYDNGNLFTRRENDYEIALFNDGRLQYEFKDGKLTINPEFFSFYKIGAKSENSPNHWDEKCILDPKKKTLLCLGGDQTFDAREANGNINAFAKVFGLSPQQLRTMQLCSCYRPSGFSVGITHLFSKSKDRDAQVKQDYKREILHKFMPFMAKTKDGQFERYSASKLYENFRNIIIQAHCYGANDLLVISDVFKETLSKLNYSEDETERALRQIVCISNNSQREFVDNTGFTMLHRYSVKDGQFEPEYDTKKSDAYPVFLSDYPKYSRKKGKKYAIVPLRDNEALIVLDRVLINGSEHNEAFWTTSKEKLTPAGKKQADLIKAIGQFWYANKSDIPDVMSLIQKAVKGTHHEHDVNMAIFEGSKLKTEQSNMLVNHNKLKKVWIEFNEGNIPEEYKIFDKMLAVKKGKAK